MSKKKMQFNESLIKGLTLQEWIKKISNGEYQEVKYGQWKKASNDTCCLAVECTACGQFEEQQFNYCPNCGAKMEVNYE